MQVKAENVTDGCDITTTQYSFSGQPLTVVVRYQKKGNQSTNPYGGDQNDLRRVGQVGGYPQIDQ